mgnify:CR=1 FL=1
MKLDLFGLDFIKISNNLYLFLTFRESLDPILAQKIGFGPGFGEYF